MQTAVTSLMEEHPIANLINATKENVEKITNEIGEMRAKFTQLNREMWDATHLEEAKEGGLRTSHK